jgi:hypothetical protein
MWRETRFRGESVVSVAALKGGVTGWGVFSGPKGSGLLPVNLSEVAGHHQ